MTDSAALLADDVLPPRPLRQWVLSLPFALRFLLATDAEALTQVLGIVCVLVSFQERATGGAARGLPRGTIGAAEVMKFCAAAGCETDSVSRSAGRVARIPVMRHSHQYRQAVQSAYPPR